MQAEVKTNVAGDSENSAVWLIYAAAWATFLALRFPDGIQLMCFLNGEEEKKFNKTPVLASGM